MAPTNRQRLVGIHSQRRWQRASLGHSQCSGKTDSASHHASPHSDLRSWILSVEFRISTQTLCSRSNQASATTYPSWLPPLRRYGSCQVLRYRPARRVAFKSITQSARQKSPWLIGRYLRAGIMSTASHSRLKKARCRVVHFLHS